MRNPHIVRYGADALRHLFAPERRRQPQLRRIMQGPGDRQGIVHDFLLRHVTD
jgi:hypothetical protein